MTYPFPDKLNIQASGFGQVLTARQSIARAKRVMLDIEKISPWRRPFSVTGCTESTGNLPIAEDFSNFDEMVMRALQSYDERKYFNEGEPDNFELMPDSTSSLGFRETFYKCSTRDDYESAVSISLQSSGTKNGLSLDDSLYIIQIRAFEHDQVNEQWSNSSLVHTLFNYFIDTYDPVRCRVYSSYQGLRTDTEEPSYNMGWLNYTRDPKVAGVFVSTGKSVPYRNGVLLSFGDDASALSDPKVDAELIEIRSALRSVGVSCF